MKTKGILIAAFVFVLSAFASAGTVSFTTSGTFGSTGTATSTTGVSFQGATDCAAGCIVNGAINYVNLGKFIASGSSTNPGSDTFTLTITQTSPTGNGTLTATVTGHVTVGGKHSTAKVNFNGTTTVTIAGVVYTVTNPKITVSVGLVGSTIQGNIAAPEPSAGLLLGLASLGLFGFAWVSRGRMLNT